MKRFCLLALMAALLAPLPASAQKNEIAAVVNADVITHSDLVRRTALVIKTSGMPETDEMRQRIRPQVLNGLIEEAIKRQEAKRLGVDVTPEDLDGAIAGIAQQNKMSAEQFLAMLGQRGVSQDELRRQVRGQLFWNKIVTGKLRNQIQVSDTDVDTELEALSALSGKTEYRVAEIMLPVDDAKQEAEVRQFATRLVGQLRAQPDAFPSLARQFSRAPGAEQGGDIGWVRDGQLADELMAAITTLPDRGISDVIRTQSGIHIVTVVGRRTLTPENLPTRDQILNKIGMDRLDRLQRRYYLDLRSSAFIETRV